MTTAIIAEKPSVAREIAAIVGAAQKNEGYLSGNNYIITWAFGHLVQLAMPDEYGIKGFSREHLPILPNPFILKVRQVKDAKGYKDDPGAIKQINIIKDVFNRCDRIINCCDAGREGELIFRYIYEYIGCTKPFDRLWISSLTEKAIKDGLQNIREGKAYDRLYHAAKARSEADWVVGINASQALSIAAGYGTYSLGRVQTPALAMVCKRYLENTGFIPVKYWQHKLSISKDDAGPDIISENKYDGIEDAKAAGEQIRKGQKVIVRYIEKKTVTQNPPLLYDLTSLQKEANSRYGLTADETLSIAQKLYEGKLTTYPRTGSRYLSEDVFDTISGLLSSFRDHSVFGEHIGNLATLNRQSVDDAKVTDHHAIIITGNRPDNLSKNESLVFNMILGRMSEAFSEVCIKEQTHVKFEAEGGNIFSAKGYIIKQARWRAVYGSSDESEDKENQSIPQISENEEWAINTLDVLEKQTRPKPLHTESSLLAAMENAGKEIDDGELRHSLKDCGIGTPATRAAIIETLLARDYIKREKKMLVPTEKGLQVYHIVKDKRIADAEMTGMWENAFVKIEQGEQEPDNFQKGIEVYASQITGELLASKIQSPQKQICLCPQCKKEQLLSYPSLVRCADKECNFVFYRKRNDKVLTDKQIISLFTTGKTEVIKGFKSKNGKSFDASLVLDGNMEIKYKFPENKENKRK
jgi:DNA topoisomerase-3